MAAAAASRASAVDDPRVNAFGVLLETFDHLERLLGSVMEHDSGLQHTWFEALIRIAHAPGRQLPMSELGRQIALTSGGITRLVDRMADAGYVTRKSLDNDRRVQLATITARGCSVLERAAAKHAVAIETHFTGKLTPAELQTLLDLLEKVDPRLPGDLPTTSGASKSR